MCPFFCFFVVFFFVNLQSLLCYFGLEVESGIVRRKIRHPYKSKNVLT